MYGLRGWGRYFWFQNHGDVSWEAFFFAPLIYLLLMTMGYARIDCQKIMPHVLVNSAPYQALNQAMEEVRPEGWRLTTDGRYTQDLENQNRIFITYWLESISSNESYEYTWSWTVPRNLLKQDDPEVVKNRLEECELVPMTPGAELVHPRVLELMEILSPPPDQP